ncbi:MAG: MarP family serine protease [Actinomycetota bacterium]|jgi:S1-C subfamily serine protease|nr:MarP family serine protease [Actinomycetota bacterium]
MNDFDIGILVAAALAALGGWRMGFLARVFSWLGLGAGIYFAVRYLPRIVSFFDVSGSVARVALAIAVLLVLAFIGQGIGLMVGSRLHSVLPFGGVRAFDRLVGALLGVVGILALVWLLAPSLAAVPGSVSQLTTGSAIARWVSNESRRVGLDPPNTLQALRRLVGEDGFPQVFTTFGPSQDAGRPPATDPLPAGVLSAAEASTVKVEGQACGRIQEGSGWTAGNDLVVTNAHVVAGEPAGATYVLLPDGARLPASVVLYNPDVDLALLKVPGLGETPLGLAAPSAGEKGAVLGHPNGQDALAVQPATIANQVTAVGEDLYGTHRTTRRVLVLAARLTYGDSGAPLVDQQGQVVGIAFAIAPDRPTTSYALDAPAELAPLLGSAHSSVVSTEACVQG